MEVALCGLGRAGKEVVRAFHDLEDLRLVYAFCRDNSDKRGKDIGLIADLPAMGAPAVGISDADEWFARYRPDVLIDFSNPVATRQILQACKRHQVSAVVCTTGFTEADLHWMQGFTEDEDFGVMYAPNVTVGVNVMMNLLRTAAHCLPYYDYNITEIHHSKKVDRPSGTAQKIAALLKQELHLEPGEQININSVRAGGYVGVHQVLAAGEYDRITIIHESFSRRAFAEGALKAARYIMEHTGWHEMEDVVVYRDDILHIPLQM